jgi:hypothetical protein
LISAYHRIFASEFASLDRRARTYVLKSFLLCSQFKPFHGPCQFFIFTKLFAVDFMLVHPIPKQAWLPANRGRVSREERGFCARHAIASKPSDVFHCPHDAAAVCKAFATAAPFYHRILLKKLRCSHQGRSPYFSRRKIFEELKRCERMLAEFYG